MNKTGGERRKVKTHDLVVKSVS